MKHRLPLRLWSILLLAAGYGWAGGHFIPGDAPVWAYLFQFGMLLILFLLATAFIAGVAGWKTSPARMKRIVIGLNIYAVVTLLINIANIVRGFMADSHYGSKNTFADLVPIILIMTGDVLWLLMSRRDRTKLLVF